MAMTEEGYFSNPQQEKFYFRRYGSKQSKQHLVFSHATGLNAQTYHELILKLQTKLPEFCIWSFDARSHGKTQAAAKLRPWEQAVKDLTWFLSHLPKVSIYLVGHSFGATNSLSVAQEGNIPVEKLVLIDPVLFDGRLLTRLKGIGHLYPKISLKLLLRAIYYLITMKGLPHPMSDRTQKRRTDFESTQAVIDSYRGKGIFHGFSEAVLSDYVHAGTKQIDPANSAVRLTCDPVHEAAIYRSSLKNTLEVLKKLTTPSLVLKAAAFSTTRDECIDLIKQNPAIQLKELVDSDHMLALKRMDEIVDEIYHYVAAD